MKSTQDKVRYLYAQVFGRNQIKPCQPIVMAELAPGVVAVLDNHNECDLFFELNGWGYIRPDLWQGLGLGEIKDQGLGILPGMGCSPAVRTIQEMIVFGKNQLYSVMGHTWHSKPHVFSF